MYRRSARSQMGLVANGLPSPSGLIGNVAAHLRCTLDCSKDWGYAMDIRLAVIAVAIAVAGFGLAACSDSSSPKDPGNSVPASPLPSSSITTFSMDSGS